MINHLTINAQLFSQNGSIHILAKIIFVGYGYIFF